MLLCVVKILANTAKAAAIKQKEEADSANAVLADAEAAAVKMSGGGELKGPDLKAAVGAVILFTEQPNAGSRSSYNNRDKCIAFLDALPVSWISLLPGARATSNAAVAVAVDAIDKADAEWARAQADHQPPAPPTFAPALPAANARTAPIDVGALSPDERASLLAQLQAMGGP